MLTLSCGNRVMQAQQITCKGRYVADVSGEPIIGASVVVKGTLARYSFRLGR